MTFGNICVTDKFYMVILVGVCLYLPLLTSSKGLYFEGHHEKVTAVPVVVDESRYCTSLYVPCTGCVLRVDSEEKRSQKILILNQNIFTE